MYKVFFNESYFLLCDKTKFIKNKGNVFVYQNIISLRDHVQSCLNSNQPFQSIIYAPNLDLLFSHFRTGFQVVNAAGGAVVEDSNLLLIKRFGLHDLPKGHVEDSESFVECAIREVKEECGIKNLKVIAPIDETWHIYYRDNQWNLKHTYWYLMNCSLSEKLKPQRDEGIEDVFWIPMYEIDEIKNTTHPSLLDLLEKVQDPSCIF